MVTFNISLGAWDITFGNKNIIVAVLDAGLQWDDTEFGPVDDAIDMVAHNSGEDEWPNWTYASGNGNDDDGNGLVDDLKGWDFYNVTQDNNHVNHYSEDNDVRPNHSTFWHGTAVAGVIAAKTNNNNGITGIAGGDIGDNKPGIKLLSLKIGDLVYYGYPINGYEEIVSTASVQRAIVYAVNMGAKVINMSFRCGYDPKENLTAEVDYAYNSGVTLIAAAGNDYTYPYDYISYPANMEKVIAVGATDINDNRESYSQTGPELEIAAPGGDDNSTNNPNQITVLKNDGTTVSSWGTSFSAPMVSATVGLMLSVNPNLPVDGEKSVRSILHETADKTGTYPYDNDGWNKYLGYGRLNTYEAVCKAIDYKKAIEVDQNGTWTDRVISQKDITIKSGTHLTIKGEVMMGKNARIIVEPGAVLTVDGGIITNIPFCGKENERWWAIEVRGNINDNQFEYSGHPLAQGKLILNNATIENAIVAVRTFQYQDFSTSGGIVYADNTVFKNNLKALSIWRYKNILNGVEYDYKAGFSNCTFVNDNDRIGGGVYSSWQVDLYGVRGITFNECSFINNTINNEPSGIAISSYNAGFDINKTCVDFPTIPCPTSGFSTTTFKGFKKAIEASSNYTYPVSVFKSDFINNSYGIYLSAVNVPVIVNNTFELGTFNGCSNGSQGVGIYLDNSKMFAIENNSFKLQQNAVPADYTGIVTINTNNMEDEIYKNDFDDMIVANRAKGKNYDNDPFTGLAYYCNTNQDNVWDFSVERLGNINDIQTLQGSRIYPAGNTFSTNATSHFYNNGDHEIDYYHESGNTAQTPTLLYRVTPDPIQYSNTCPSHYTTGGDIYLSSSAYQQHETDYNTALASFNTASSNYDNATDSATRSYWADKISYYNMQLARAAYDIIRSDMADTVTHPGKFTAWMQKLNTYTSNEALIDYYMQQGDYTTALNKIDSLPYQFTFTAYDSVEYPMYKDFKNMQATWLADGRTVFGLTNTEINNLIAIADSSKGTAGAQARGILLFAYDSLYSHIDCMGTPGSNNKSADFYGKTGNKNNTLNVTISPNPADNTVTFSFTLPDKVNTGTLEIFDSNGKKVKIVQTGNSGIKTVDCSFMPQGIYFYCFTAGASTSKGKFIIKH